MDGARADMERGIFGYATVFSAPASCRLVLSRISCGGGSSVGRADANQIGGNVGSYLLTPELARQAVDQILPSVHAMMASGFTNRKSLHIVVLDPTVKHAPNRSVLDALRFEYSLGNHKDWDYPFDEIAWAKAAISWETGLPSHLVQTRAPFLYRRGHTIFGGSAVLDGLVVACSGIKWYDDQRIAEWVASACRALCLREMEKILASDANFLM